MTIRPSGPISPQPPRPQEQAYERPLTSYAKEFLSFLADSQKTEDFNKLNNVSHLLTIFMFIGKTSSSSLLPPQEENELIELLSNLKNQYQYSGLDLSSLQNELNIILEKKLNNKCSVIKTLMQIEYSLCITPPANKLPISVEDVENITTPLIDTLPRLSNLEIKYLTHQLNDINEMAQNETENVGLILENLKQTITHFHR
jgi:hypothetical protein